MDALRVSELVGGSLTWTLLKGGLSRPEEMEMKVPFDWGCPTQPVMPSLWDSLSLSLSLDLSVYLSFSLDLSVFNSRSIFIPDSPPLFSISLSIFLVVSSLPVSNPFFISLFLYFSFSPYISLCGAYCPICLPLSLSLSLCFLFFALFQIQTLYLYISL